MLMFLVLYTAKVLYWALYYTNKNYCDLHVTHEVIKLTATVRKNSTPNVRQEYTNT